MIYINSVTVTPTVIRMKLNETYYNPNVEILPSNATCPCVEWSTLHPNTVSVNPKYGHIHALRAGTAIVNAIAADGSGKYDSITVIVEESPVTNINITKSSLSLTEGQHAELIASLTPDTATYADIVWASDNPDIVSVIGGQVQAKKVGSTIIRAVAVGNTYIYDTCYVTVNSAKVLVSSISLNYSFLSKPVHSSIFLRASVAPSNASNDCIKWTSSNTTIAEVQDNGYVWTKKAGTVTITASATDGSGIYSTCIIEVTDHVPVTGIEISKQEMILEVGDIEKLYANIQPSDASNKSVSWCSCNPNIAFVGLYTGTVEAKLAGRTTITATTADGNLVATCTVTVKQKLTYPDTLIDNTSVRDNIIRYKTLIDENEVAYSNGNITLNERNIIKEQLQIQCDVARADFIASGNNPTSQYAYEILGGDPSNGIPYSFKNDIKINSTGLSVIVIQRALEVLGYYEAEKSEKYGVFDENTYEAACAYPNLMATKDSSGNYVFDAGSFNVLFQVGNSEERNFSAFTELNKFRVIHNMVAQYVAEKKVNGTYKMSDNKIMNGNSASNYYGYADVLKQTLDDTYIWEVKPDKERYYRQGGIGERQLTRYLYAGNTFPQTFKKPLKTGYSLGSFSLPDFLNDKYISVRSFSNPALSTDVRNGLILYKVEDEPSYTIESVPVFVEEPEKSYNYSQDYYFDTQTWGPIIVVGIIVVVGIVCVATYVPSGGTSIALPLCLLAA